LSRDRDIKKTNEVVFEQIREEQRKSKQFQQQMFDTFTVTPPDLRELLLRIEAQNRGFQIIDGQIVDDSEQPVNEQTAKMVEDETNKAMLRSNPKMEELNYEYKDGFFVTISVKKMLEKEGKA
tara:strand:- start:504 stop:872 length:369 start_codon:yes stop_codon:yes gene_type:complete